MYCQVVLLGKGHHQARWQLRRALCRSAPRSYYAVKAYRWACETVFAKLDPYDLSFSAQAKGNGAASNSLPPQIVDYTYCYVGTLHTGGCVEDEDVLLMMVRDLTKAVDGLSARIHMFSLPSASLLGCNVTSTQDAVLLAVAPAVEASETVLSAALKRWGVSDGSYMQELLGSVWLHDGAVHVTPPALCRVADLLLLSPAVKTLGDHMAMEGENSDHADPPLDGNVHQQLKPERLVLPPANVKWSDYVECDLSTALDEWLAREVEKRTLPRSAHSFVAAVSPVMAILLAPPVSRGGCRGTVSQTRTEKVYARDDQDGRLPHDILRDAIVSHYIKYPVAKVGTGTHHSSVEVAPTCNFTSLAELCKSPSDGKLEEAMHETRTLQRLTLDYESMLATGRSVRVPVLHLPRFLFALLLSDSDVPQKHLARLAQAHERWTQSLERQRQMRDHHNKQKENEEEQRDKEEGHYNTLNIAEHASHVTSDGDPLVVEPTVAEIVLGYKLTWALERWRQRSRAKAKQSTTLSLRRCSAPRVPHASESCTWVSCRLLKHLFDRAEMELNVRFGPKASSSVCSELNPRMIRPDSAEYRAFLSQLMQPLPPSYRGDPDEWVTQYAREAKIEIYQGQSVAGCIGEEQEEGEKAGEMCEKMIQQNFLLFDQRMGWTGSTSSSTRSSSASSSDGGSGFEWEEQDLHDYTSSKGGPDIGVAKLQGVMDQERQRWENEPFIDDPDDAPSDLDPAAADMIMEVLNRVRMEVEQNIQY